MSGARWVYLKAHGLADADLKGLVVRHTCDNGNCVEVSHLIVGSQRDNVQDSIDRDRHSAGERHGCAKLTEAQVREIRSRYVRGNTRWDPGNRKELEREFGVSRTTINDIVNGKKWPHVVS
jgi:hypothetical protein